LPLWFIALGGLRQCPTPAFAVVLGGFKGFRDIVKDRIAIGIDGRAGTACMPAAEQTAHTHTGGVVFRQFV
jgi:hypothetical protein